MSHRLTEPQQFILFKQKFINFPLFYTLFYYHILIYYFTFFLHVFLEQWRPTVSL